MDINNLTGIEIARLISENNLDQICPKFYYYFDNNGLDKKIKLKDKSKLNENVNLEDNNYIIIYKPFDGDVNLCKLYLKESNNCIEIFNLIEFLISRNFDNGKLKKDREVNEIREIVLKILNILSFILESDNKYNLINNNNLIDIVNNILNCYPTIFNSIFNNSNNILNSKSEPGKEGISVNAIYNNNLLIKLLVTCINKIHGNDKLLVILNKINMNDVIRQIYTIKSDNLEISKDNDSLFIVCFNEYLLDSLINNPYSRVSNIYSNILDNINNVINNYCNMDGNNKRKKDEITMDNIYYEYDSMRVILLLKLLSKISGGGSYFYRDCHSERLVNKFFNTFFINNNTNVNVLIINVLLVLSYEDKTNKYNLFHLTNNGIIYLVNKCNDYKDDLINNLFFNLFKIILIKNNNKLVVNRFLVKNILIKYNVEYISSNLDKINSINRFVCIDYIDLYLFNIKNLNNDNIFVILKLSDYYLKFTNNLPKIFLESKQHLNNILNYININLYNNNNFNNITTVVVNQLLKLLINIIENNCKLILDIKNIINIFNKINNSKKDNNFTDDKSNKLNENDRKLIELYKNYLLLLYKYYLYNNKKKWEYKMIKYILDPLKFYNNDLINSNYNFITKLLTNLPQTLFNDNSNYPVNVENDSNKTYNLLENYRDEFLSQLKLDMHLMDIIYYYGINGSILINKLYNNYFYILLYRFCLLNNIINNNQDYFINNKNNNKFKKILLNYYNNLLYYIQTIFNDINNNVIKPTTINNIKLDKDMDLKNIKNNGDDKSYENNVLKINEADNSIYITNINNVNILNIMIVIYNIIINYNIRLFYKCSQVDDDNKSNGDDGVSATCICIDCLLNKNKVNNIYLNVLLMILIQLNYCSNFNDSNKLKNMERYIKCNKCNNDNYNIIYLIIKYYDNYNINDKNNNIEGIEIINILNNYFKHYIINVLNNYSNNYKIINNELTNRGDMIVVNRNINKLYKLLLIKYYNNNIDLNINNIIIQLLFFLTDYNNYYNNNIDVITKLLISINSNNNNKYLLYYLYYNYNNLNINIIINLLKLLLSNNFNKLLINNINDFNLVE